MMRYFTSFSRKEGGKARHVAGAAAERAAQESEEADADEDDTSPSPPIEDSWRTPLAQCALVTLLGGLALVFVVAAVAQASRKGISQSVVRLHSDVAETTVSPEESQDYAPVKQVPLNDIDEPSPRVGATVRASGDSEGGAEFLHSDSLEEGSAIASTSETPVILSTPGERQQEIIGKMRLLKADTVRRLRKAKDARVCQPPSFTYCNAARPEFYYNHSSRDCEAVSRGVQLCNRGPNRFPSKHSCHRKCVKPHRPHDLCSQVVTFVECSRPDYKDVPRWYFDGKRCRRWRRSRDDRCPSGQTFTTAQGLAPQRLSPYFAHRTRQSDPFHCISLSSLRMSRDGQRLCIKGSNRFRTVEACREACTRGGE
ncbi:hypothetical protein MTO96_026432 [Rhipicephalus appendiculatus]